MPIARQFGDARFAVARRYGNDVADRVGERDESLGRIVDAIVNADDRAAVPLDVVDDVGVELSMQVVIVGCVAHGVDLFGEEGLPFDSDRVGDRPECGIFSLWAQSGPMPSVFEMMSVRGREQIEQRSDTGITVR